MRRTIPLLAAVLLAGILAGGAVGVIVGASSAPTIRACVTKTTNVMRYLPSGSCKPGEKLLTWNVQGPRGAAGATGAQGEQGPQGPAGGSGSGGSSAGTFYLADGGNVSFAGGPATLVSLRVPAGSYLIDFTGVLDLVNSAAIPGNATCTITTDADLATTPPFLVTFGGRAFGLRVYAELAATTTVNGMCGGGITEQTKAVQLVATVARRLPAVP